MIYALGPANIQLVVRSTLRNLAMVGIILCGVALVEGDFREIGPMGFYKTHFVFCTVPTQEFIF